MICAITHGIADENLPYRSQPWVDSPERSIVIGNNVWIGAGAIILPGTTIGDGAVIAAGTVVKGRIPGRSIVKAETSLKIEPIDPQRSASR
jgi:acetyltransferase-like isoleucine patch superfamily enzyme